MFRWTSEGSVIKGWLESKCRKRRIVNWLFLVFSLVSCGGGSSEPNAVVPTVSASSQAAKVLPDQVNPNAGIDEVAEISSSIDAEVATDGVLGSEAIDVVVDEVAIGMEVLDEDFIDQAIGDVSLMTVDESFFYENIQGPVVNQYCIRCHIESGIAAHTALVFSGESLGDASVFKAFAMKKEREFILRKVLGFNDHGGGAVLNRVLDEYVQLEAYLNLVLPAPKSLSVVNKMALEVRAKTLRRAALIVAGRLPSNEELAQANSGEDGLRVALSELMQGNGFRSYLMRATNDKLLTDSFINGQYFPISNSFEPYYPVGANKRYAAYESGDIWPYEHWRHDVYHGMVRAPLALVAHVVMNDLPYTEILTADYTLGNKSTAEYMRQSVDFENGDKFDVKPFKNNGQILLQPGHSQFYDRRIGVRIDAHGEWVEYPHAGLLNEPAFLARYPTTSTNRNRLRAQKVYELFLGVDVANLAARSIPAQALSDTDTPTLNNPACVSCHQTLDRVAGAFQNYSNEGWYRASWLGLDALPRSYKDAPGSAYEKGDLWFRDMLPPGFEGVDVLGESSLAELASLIVEDDRFAEATIKFWWPSIMSDELLKSDEGSADQVKAIFIEQQSFIAQLALEFTAGIKGGSAYSLKDLLLEMLMSRWFRGGSIGAENSEVNSNPPNYLGVAGVRLLTPEELESKVKGLLGFAWGEREDYRRNNGLWSVLDDQLSTYYGGVDSVGVLDRVKEINSLMANVAEAQALNLACASVLLDVNRTPESQKLLRNQLQYVTPYSNDWQRINLAEPQKITLNVLLQAGRNTLRISHLNGERIGPVIFSGLLFDEKKEGGITIIDSVSFSRIEGHELGVRSGEDIVLEKGYVDLVIFSDTERLFKVDVDVLAPVQWVEPLKLSLDVLNYETGKLNAGELLIKHQLVDLFAAVSGLSYDIESAEVLAAYDLFVNMWLNLDLSDSPITLAEHDKNHCNLDALGLPKLQALNASDPQRLLSAWSHMMVYYFTDFNFLHE